MDIAAEEGREGNRPTHAPPLPAGDPTEREQRLALLFTSHGLVVIAVAERPGCTIQDIAAMTRLGRSNILGTLGDLKQAKIVTVNKRGRRNTYEINAAAVLRHPSLDEPEAADFLRALLSSTPAPATEFESRPAAKGRR